jgi:hypothetical protein
MNATVAHVEGRYRLLAIDDKCAQGIKKSRTKRPGKFNREFQRGAGKSAGRRGALWHDP